MERENSVNTVTDLACILESFFKGLSECGILSVYSLQLQDAGSDVTGHVKFQHHIFSFIKSLQGLLRRLSEVSEGKNVTADQTTQTDNDYSNTFRRRALFTSSHQRVGSKKMILKVPSEAPAKTLTAHCRSTLNTKVQVESPPLPSINLLHSSSDFGNPLHNSHPAATLRCLSSDNSQCSNHSHTLEEVPHSKNENNNLPEISGTRHLSSQMSTAILDARTTVASQKIHSNRLCLVATSGSVNDHQRTSVDQHVLSSSCSEFSDSSQIHSIETTSTLVPQDLIAVLGSEDVAEQHQRAVLFLSSEDPRGEISSDVADMQERQLNGGNLRIGVDDGNESMHHDSTLYSYSDIVDKENSNKSMKVGMVASLRGHEDDLVLFCKGEVELDPIPSVSVETVEKDGELMSIFASDGVKGDEDDSSTVLYVNEDVLNSKKSVNLGHSVSAKETISNHFFNKKLITENGRASDFALMGMKMEEELNSRGSEEDSSVFQKRVAEESIAEMSADKDGTVSNEEIIGIDGDLDPEDELGSNFVHIVVTASRMMPNEADEEKLKETTHKLKCDRCAKRNKSECSCTSCETSFPLLASLQCHLKKKHGNVSQCDFCQKVFPTIGSLVDHCRDVHNGAGCFECEECGKRLKSRLSLRRHMESHQGRKEAVCSNCGKTFCRWDYLIRHYQMVHAKERPHQCNQCSQRFLSRGHLRNHLSVHSGERNHKCGICGKMFSRGDKLREHMFRHSSTKRHSCPTCGRTYADKRDLNKHQMRDPGCQSGKRAQAKADSRVETGKTLS